MANTIWVADDDSSIVWVISTALEKSGFSVDTFENAESLLNALATSKPDLIISDIHMSGMTGFQLLEKINLLGYAIPVIVITAFGDLDSAVDAYKYGAYEYLTKPFDISELNEIVDKALSGMVKVDGSSVDATMTNREILGDSRAMQLVFKTIGKIAPSNMGVLIRGESGTGKELVAEAIYKNSSRSDKPFVAINTAAIPAELLESEIFGHEKGAFTGAHTTHIGRFEQANGGTLFLDEIGDMPLGLQTRLLRVLSEGRFYRVGGRDELAVDVRVIAATNQDLENMVSQGTFRNDLFHRLNVLSLEIPALRERVEDIPMLVDYFLQELASLENEEPKSVSREVITELQSCLWPGNVRELRNMVQQLVIMSSGQKIVPEDLPASLKAGNASRNSLSWLSAVEDEIKHRISIGEQGLTSTIGLEFERALVGQALSHTQGHRQKAAKLLGWGRNTLTRKLNEYHEESQG